MESIYYKVQSSLNKEDFDYLKAEGYAMSAVIRKIVSDWVTYKKATRNNPFQVLEGEGEE